MRNIINLFSQMLVKLQSQDSHPRLSNCKSLCNHLISFTILSFFKFPIPWFKGQKFCLGFLPNSQAVCSLVSLQVPLSLTLSSLLTFPRFLSKTLFSPWATPTIPFVPAELITCGDAKVSFAHPVCPTACMNL